MAGTTWNPSDNSNAVLSNGNLTATFNTSASTWRSVRSTNPKSSGKLHFECTISAQDAGDGWILGIGDATASLTNYCGSDVHGIGQDQLPGTGLDIFQNAALQGGGQYASTTWGATGHVIAVEVDIANKLVWFQDVTAATGWTDAAQHFTGNPGAGTGGLTWTATAPIMIIASGFFNLSVADTFILNPGPGGFTGVVSTGFTAWDAATGLAMSNGGKARYLGT